MSEIQKTKKKAVGRNKTALFNSMRAVAWVNDLKRRTGVASDEKLKATVIPADRVLEFRFGRYLSGKTVPSEMIRNTVHRYSPVEKSKYVFEIGPEENGEFIPLWMLFENRCDEYWPVIENVISLNSGSVGGAHSNRIDRLAAVFLTPDQWASIKSSDEFPYTFANEINDSMEAGFFKPELRLLAAVIALWRLSIFVRDGVAATEFLLQKLLAEPYKDVLGEHGIYNHVCMLVRAISIQHHAFEGNLTGAARTFGELDQQCSAFKL